MVINSKESTVNVRAVSRALAILRSFEARKSASLAEVALGAELDKGTARRLLITLMDAGFVVQDSASQRYGLGRAVHDLARRVVVSDDLRTIAAPFLARLAASQGMTVIVSVFENGLALCIDYAHDSTGVEIKRWKIGGTLVPNCGGAPKVLLAFQNPDEINRVLCAHLPKLTRHTVTDPKALEKRFALIRKRGWELAADDVELGLTSLAVPIVNQRGAIAAALSLVGLSPKFMMRGKPTQLDSLKATATEIASRLP